MHPSFDVFISHKSQDADMAKALALYLIKKGFSVFFSEISLPQIGSSNYRQAIDTAIDQSRHMVIIASSLTNIESKWVAFEWGAFENNLRSGKAGNLLTIVNFDFDPKKFPLALRNHEIIRYSLKNFQRIIPYLSKSEQGGLAGLSDSIQKLQQKNTKPLGTFLTQQPILPPGISISRSTDIHEMDQILKKNTPIVLHGIGGIGKTTLAKIFVQKRAKSYNFILWIEYINNIYSSIFSQTISRGLRFDWDASKKDDENFSLFIQALDDLPGQKLIIIDNINDEQDIKVLLEQPPLNTHILLTSRYKPQQAVSYSPKPLSISEARTLFYQYYLGKRDDDCLDLLLQLIHCHTLTIELLAKTAESLLNTTIRKLYENFKKNRLNSSEFKKINIPLHYNKRSVETQMYTFMLELFDISNLNNDEKATLANFAILPYTDFSEEELIFLFVSAPDEINFSEKIIDLSNLLASLIRKGWIIKEGRNYRLHPVLQEVLRDKLKITPSTVELVIQAVIKKLDSVKDHLSILGLKELETLKFVDIAISISTFFSDAREFPLAELNFNLSFILQKLLRYEESVTFQQRAILTLIRYHPEKKQLLANSYDNMALILRELARYDEAIDYELKAISLKTDDKEFNDVELSFTYHRISGIYALKGELKPAFNYLLMAVKLRETELGDQDLATVNSYHDLAALYADVGNTDQAVTYIRKVVEVRQARIPVSIDSANSYSVFSTITYLQGDYSNALDCQEKAHSLYLSVLYEDHWRIGHSFSKLALVHLALNEMQLATDFQKEALRIKEMVFGNDHPLTAFAYNVSALIAYENQEFTESLRIQKRILEIREKYLFKNSMDTGHTYLRLAELYLKLGNLVDAKHALSNARQIFNANDLPKESLFMKILVNLGSYLTDLD